MKCFPFFATSVYIDFTQQITALLFMTLSTSAHSFCQSSGIYFDLCVDIVFVVSFLCEIKISPITFQLRNKYCFSWFKRHHHFQHSIELINFFFIFSANNNSICKCFCFCFVLYFRIFFSPFSSIFEICQIVCLDYCVTEFMRYELKKC